MSSEARKLQAVLIIAMLGFAETRQIQVDVISNAGPGLKTSRVASTTSDVCKGDVAEHPPQSVAATIGKLLDRFLGVLALTRTHEGEVSKPRRLQVRDVETGEFSEDDFRAKMFDASTDVEKLRRTRTSNSTEVDYWDLAARIQLLRRLELDHWNEFAYSLRPDIFGQQGNLATDSGFNNVKNLLYNTQYVHAAMNMLCGALNNYVIMKSDISLIMMPSAEEPDFLLSKTILGRILGHRVPRFHMYVPMFELGYLGFLVLRIMKNAITAVCAPRLFKYNKDWKRWSNTRTLFWDLLPSLSFFSAMRLLHHWIPTVIATEAYTKAVLTWQSFVVENTAVDRFIAVLDLLFWVIQSFFYLMFGYDAFIIKLVMVARRIHKMNSFYREDFFFTAIFLIQMLGVVNLNWFVRNRLFIFVFGGEDGKLGIEEDAVITVWQALLAKKIYEEFGLWKFIVVMVGLDDYDFQRLAFDSGTRRRVDSSDEPVAERNKPDTPSIARFVYSVHRFSWNFLRRR